MVSLTKWLIDHEKAALWIAVILLFLPPVAICILASLTNIFSDGVSAGDVLTYLAGYGAFIGTVGLGCATIHQADLAKEQATHNINVNTKRPFFVMDDVYYKQNKQKKSVPWNTNRYCLQYKNRMTLKVRLLNVGDGIADKVIVEPYGFGRVSKNSIPVKSVKKGDAYELSIPAIDNLKNSTLTEVYTLYYSNMIGARYKQAIDVSIEIIDIYEKDEDGNIYTADYDKKISIGLLSEQSVVEK